MMPPIVWAIGNNGAIRPPAASQSTAYRHRDQIDRFQLTPSRAAISVLTATVRSARPRFVLCRNRASTTVMAIPSRITISLVGNGGTDNAEFTRKRWWYALRRRAKE